MEQLGMFDEVNTLEEEKTDDSTLIDATVIDQMKDLIVYLNVAAKAYYSEGTEVMTNREYDEKYDLLRSLEEKTGVILSNSPTQRVGYEVLSELPKIAHPSRMLSLDKTKDVDQLIAFLGNQDGVMSWKLDGLTIVLTYVDGKLEQAVTRGNGEVGEVITQNARTFTNIPVVIPFKGEVVVRGEAVITYPDFEHINEGITDEGSKYKNPRNLCSGSVRQLDPSVTKKRFVRFYAFNLVSAEGLEFKFRTEQFDWLENQGFNVVERKKVTSDTIPETVKWFSEAISDNIIPSDGLVLSIDDIAFGKTLGVTAKYPKDSIAFKWQDEVKDTILKEIEWSASRTGLINPVAIFEPIELEGTTVSRASVHNISVMKDLKLKLEDQIMVYKANMIIPQIAENLTGEERGTFGIEIPKSCPVCGADTVIKNENGVETLFCPNEECPAKQIKGFSHFVSRDAMNIEGLSEMTLEKLVDKGIIKEFSDLFNVDSYKDEIIEMEGFGELSFTNLVNAINKARTAAPENFLYSLGIPNFGKANAKLISKHCQNKWEQISNLTVEELLTIDGIGDVMANDFVSFFKDESKRKIVSDLLNEVTLDESFTESGDLFKDVTFVITGSLNFYDNRDQLKDIIESLGGKVAGSVSNKTSYLINNDLLSTSGKNKKAKELNVPIISEETVKKWIDNGLIEL